MRVHCEKTSLYTTFWLKRMCSHDIALIEARVCIQLVTQFPMLCSTDMFPRSVSTTRRIHARVHTLKDGCVYTFWLTKSCLFVTLNISHLVCHIPQVQSKQSTTSQLFKLMNPSHYATFDLQRRLRAQLSHRRTCLCATYHIISYVFSRPPCFRAVCWLPDVFMCMYAH